MAITEAALEPMTTHDARDIWQIVLAAARGLANRPLVELAPSVMIGTRREWIFHARANRSDFSRVSSWRGAVKRFLQNEHESGKGVMPCAYVLYSDDSVTRFTLDRCGNLHQSTAKP